jgi:ribosomal protein L29
MKKHHLISEDVRKMTDEELAAEVISQRGRHYTLRSQAVTEKVEDISQFKAAKKNVARILTEQNTRRRAKAAAASK